MPFLRFGCGEGGKFLTEHYYSERPEVESRPRRIDVSVRGVSVQLMTDAGVFAKGHLDRATAILIETVQLPKRARVVDLGCGYGPVTAVLARTYPDSRWWMLDVNERAVGLARQNTSVLGDRVIVHQSDGFAAVGGQQFTDVILNPPIRAGKAVVYRLFAEAAAHLEAGGGLWVVIQKKHGAASAEKHLRTLFQAVETAYKKSGYFVFHCTRIDS